MYIQEFSGVPLSFFDNDQWFFFFLFAAPNLKSDSDSDFSPSNSEEDEPDDEQEKEEKSEVQPKTPSKMSMAAAALHKTPAKKSKKAPEVGLCTILICSLLSQCSSCLSNCL